MSTPASVIQGDQSEPVAENLAEVMAVIDTDSNLSARRKRDLRSALKTITHALGRGDLERVPADWRRLSKPLRAVHPVQLGLKQKRWQNVIAELKFALRYVNGRLGNVPKQRAPLGPSWARLRDRIKAPGIYRGICRFMGYCDAEGVSPDAVNDHVSERYFEYLREESLSRSPERMHRRMCAIWNRAVDEVFGWPRQRLTVPNYRQPSWTLPWDHFPESFRADAEAYLAWLAGEDLVRRDPPINIYKRSTLVITERELRRLASAAVRQGVPAETLRNLEDLVKKDTVTAIAKFYWNSPSHGGKSYQKGLLKRLDLVARHWVRVDDDHQTWLQQMIRRWQVPQTGLTEKNRAALRQFRNPVNVDLILRLPERLAGQARTTKRSPARNATLFQKALAIEILVMAPMRIGNLAALRLARHVVMPKGSQGPIHLVVSESEVKNNLPLEFELPSRSSTLLKEYLLDHRPHLVDDEDNAWLFPGVRGEHKWARTLSAQLKDIIDKETGLTLTAHQFRHLAAKLLLDRSPGAYETVRRLLGHKSLRTTTNFYTGMETLAATKQYDQVILQLRGEGNDGEVDD